MMLLQVAQLLLAVAAAAVATVAQAVPPPADWYPSGPVQVESSADRLGLSWDCGDERCYAVLADGRAITGP